MMQRCYNREHHRFHYYGGRGIEVVPEWHDFEAFLRDMGRKPSPRHSIDRIDNNGPYSPANCRWATQQEQSRNRRNAITVEVRGVTLSLGQLAQETGIPYATLLHRHHRGLDLLSGEGLDETSS